MSNLSESNSSESNRNGLNINTLCATTLYVRSWVGKLKRERLLSYFSAFGKVKNVRIRNKPRLSFGFVQFTRAKSATKVLQIKHHEIAERRVKITIAYERHQDKTINTTFLDLNDDCILEILSMKCLSTIDLCSVAETSTRLKEIAGRVFRRDNEECDVSLLSRYKPKLARRILKNFGSEISVLVVFTKGYLTRKWISVLEYVAKYSSNTLEELYLDGCYIPENLTAILKPIFTQLKKLRLKYCFFEGASKTLFSECGSLVELDICTKGTAIIIENTFPKLLRFKCDAYQYRYDPKDINLESFFSRHEKLNSLRISNNYDESDLLPLIAENCKRLEQLKCRIPVNGSYDLSFLVNLKILNIGCYNAYVIKAATGLNNLTLLESLKLVLTKVDSELIQNLSQLKNLRILRLKACSGLQNLHEIGNLHQLKKLKIESVKYVNFDIVLLIKRLINLTYLSIEDWRFQIDLETYFLIVDIVRKRPEKSKLTFRVYDGYQDILREFSQSAHIVKMEFE